MLTYIHEDASQTNKTRFGQIYVTQRIREEGGKGRGKNREGMNLQVFWYEKRFVRSMHAPIKVTYFLVHEDPHGVEVQHDAGEHHQTTVQPQGDQDAHKGTAVYLIGESRQLEKVPVHALALGRRKIDVTRRDSIAVVVSHDQVHHKDQHLQRIRAFRIGL